MSRSSASDSEKLRKAREYAAQISQKPPPEVIAAMEQLKAKKLAAQPMVDMPSDSSGMSTSSPNITVIGDRLLSSTLTGKERHLFLANVHFAVRAHEIRDLLNATGTCIDIQIPAAPLGVGDGSHTHRGFLFAEFRSHAAAAQVLDALKGLSIGNRALNSNWATNGQGLFYQPKMPDDNSPLPSMPELKRRLQVHIDMLSNRLNSSGTGAGPDGGAGAAETAADVGGDGLDDDAAIRVTSQAQRQALMQKLRHGGGGDGQLAAQRFIAVSNMCSPDQMSDARERSVLKEDVKTECENSYGRVDEIKIGVLAGTNDPVVLIKFQQVEHARSAVHGLTGRWFAMRQLKAVFVSEIDYHQAGRGGGL